MNIVLVVLCGLLSVMFFRKYFDYHPEDETRKFVLGLAFFGLGWSGHRFYWAINRTLESFGKEYTLTSIYKTTSWVTMFPMWLVVLGVGLLMEPVLRRLFKDFWFLKYNGVVFGSWLFLAVLL